MSESKLQKTVYPEERLELVNLLHMLEVEGEKFFQGYSNYSCIEMKKKSVEICKKLFSYYSGEIEALAQIIKQKEVAQKEVAQEVMQNKDSRNQDSKNQDSKTDLTVSAPKAFVYDLKRKE